MKHLKTAAVVAGSLLALGAASPALAADSGGMAGWKNTPNMKPGGPFMSPMEIVKPLPAPVVQDSPQQQAPTKAQQTPNTDQAPRHAPVNRKGNTMPQTKPAPAAPQGKAPQGKAPQGGGPLGGLSSLPVVGQVAGLLGGVGA